jgi:hypothetical protein
LLLVGCSGPSDPGVPRAANLVAEMTGPAGSRGDRFTPLQADTNGAIYVYDVSRKLLTFSGAVEQGNQIRLYPGGVAVLSVLPGRSRTPYEHWVTRFDVGVTYRIYFDSGGKPADPTPDASGSAFTRPFEERLREKRPNDTFLR